MFSSTTLLGSYIYILDYFSTAGSAYSLRKLKRSYAGSCIRVRRSSDNVEQDIGFANNVLDVASLLSFIGSNTGYIAKWYDQSGNARDAVQSTTSMQPKIVEAGVLSANQGRTGIRYYQINLSLPAYKFAAPNTASSCSFVASVDTASAGNTNNGMGSDGAGFQADGMYLTSRSDTGTFAFNKTGTAYVNSVTDAGIVNNQLFAQGGVINASNISKAYRNGYVSNTLNATSWTTGSKSTFDIGKYSVASSATVDLIGYMFEHISFSSELTDTEMFNLQRNQAQFYKISMK